MAPPATPPRDLPHRPVLATTAPPTQTPLPPLFAYLIATPTAFGYVDGGMQINCVPKRDWIPYEVQAGDTLLSLALATGTDLANFRDGNCFNPIRGIFPGETLRIPQLPRTAVAATPVFPRAGDNIRAAGCESEQARIKSPPALTELQGIFAVLGRAQIPAGGSYRLSLRPAWSDDYMNHLEFDSPVDGDMLGLINTEIFGAGLQWLRLTLLDEAGAVLAGSVCDVPLVFTAS